MNAEAASDAVDVAGGGGFRGVSYRQLLGFAARPLILLAVAMVVAGGDEIRVALDSDADVFYVRTVNLIEGAPTIDVVLGDTVVSSAAYGGGTDFSAVPSGKSELTVKAASTMADADEDVVIAPSTKTAPIFVKNTPYTLIAYGELADSHVFAVEAWCQRDAVADGKVVLQFVHAAPSAPRMDVYVTAAEAGITISRYIATLGLTEASIPLELTLARDFDGDSLLTGEIVIELRASASGRVLHRSPQISVVERHRVLFAIADTRAEEGGSVRLVSVDTAMPGG